jgi:hypothetical protein
LSAPQSQQSFALPGNIICATVATVEIEAFAGWVQSVIDADYGGVAGRLASALGIALTTLTRGMETGTMGPESLLRLAAITGRDASDVFRMARKSEWAELIESCYGPPRPEPAVVYAVKDCLTKLPDEPAREMFVVSVMGLVTAWRSRWMPSTGSVEAQEVAIRTPTKPDVQET